MTNLTAPGAWPMERVERQGPGDNRCLINQTTVPLGNGRKDHCAHEGIRTF